MPESLKITYRELLALHTGLNGLDGARSGKEEITPFEFDIATRLLLLRASADIMRQKVVFDILDRKTAEECGVYDGMEKTDANAKKLDAYQRKVEEAKDQSTDISVEKIALSALLNKPLTDDEKRRGASPRQNPIPQSVINRLFPILILEAK